MCLTITTGNGEDNDGALTLTINSEAPIEREYVKGEDVIRNRCFDSNDVLNKLTLSGPYHNAWAGSIVITEGGRPTVLYCRGCVFDSRHLVDPALGPAWPGYNNIVVDGNDNSGDYSTTRCWNGQSCSITWSRFGTVDISIVYHMKR